MLILLMENVVEREIRVTNSVPSVARMVMLLKYAIESMNIQLVSSRRILKVVLMLYQRTVKANRLSLRHPRPSHMRNTHNLWMF